MRWRICSALLRHTWDFRSSTPPSTIPTFTGLPVNPRSPTRLGFAGAGWVLVLSGFATFVGWTATTPGGRPGWALVRREPGPGCCCRRAGLRDVQMVLPLLSWAYDDPEAAAHRDRRSRPGRGGNPRGGGGPSRVTERLGEHRSRREGPPRPRPGAFAGGDRRLRGGVRRDHRRRDRCTAARRSRGRNRDTWPPSRWRDADPQGA